MSEAHGRAKAEWKGTKCKGGEHQQQSRSESESDIKGRGRTHGGEGQLSQTTDLV